MRQGTVQNKHVNRRGNTRPCSSSKLNIFAETQVPMSWFPNSSRSLTLWDIASSAFERESWCPRCGTNEGAPFSEKHSLRFFSLLGNCLRWMEQGLSFVHRRCAFLNLGLAFWDVVGLWGTDCAGTFRSWVAKTVAQTPRLCASQITCVSVRWGPVAPTQMRIVRGNQID